MLLALMQQLVMQRWLPSDPLFLMGSLITLVIIGAIIIFVAGVFIFFLPAIIVAGVVWWLTGNQFIAGIAFLLISLVSLAKRK